MSDAHDLRELEKDPRLFLYTSLTAGSSHIITATSRLETILKANKVPFQAIDCATDENARRLWQRRAGKRKLPGLVKDGFVIGDLEEVEEWNEYGELKENIGTVPAATGSVPAPKLPIVPTATAGTSTIKSTVAADLPNRIALPGAAEIAARNKPLPKIASDDTAKPETITSAPAAKEKSIEKAIRFKGEDKHEDKHVEHLSAPASAIPSTSGSPEPPKSDLEGKKSADDDTNTAADSTTAGAEKEVEQSATVNVEEDAKTSSKPTGDVSSVAKAAPDTKDSSTAKPSGVSTTTTSKTTVMDSSAASDVVSKQAEEEPAASKPAASSADKPTVSDTVAGDIADRTKPATKEVDTTASPVKPPGTSTTTTKASTTPIQTPATSTSQATKGDKAMESTAVSDAVTEKSGHSTTESAIATTAKQEKSSTSENDALKTNQPAEVIPSTDEKPAKTEAVEEKPVQTKEALKEVPVKIEAGDDEKTRKTHTSGDEKTEHAETLTDAETKKAETAADPKSKQAQSSAAVAPTQAEEKDSTSDSLADNVTTDGSATTTSKTQKQAAAEPELAAKSVDD